jgi:hypothetical protein
MAAGRPELSLTHCATAVSYAQHTGHWLNTYDRMILFKKNN